MKKFFLVACTALLIGGCSVQDVAKVDESTNQEQQEDSIVEVEDAEVEVSTDNEETESKENLLENNANEPEQKENSDTIEGNNSPATNNQTTQTSSNDSLFYEIGDRTKFESQVYFSVGDVAELIDNEEIYATVKLNNYKIIDSTDGNGRKGIAFFYTVTNTSNESIEIGAYPYAQNPTFVPEVYYGDKNLKLMKVTTPTLKMDGEEYVNNQHVQYTEDDAKMNACTKITTLESGASIDCYAHYSYAGTGNYLVGQISESQYYEWRTYWIEVSEDDLNN